VTVVKEDEYVGCRCFEYSAAQRVRSKKEGMRKREEFGT
jgi:hypothetical protein